MKKDTEWEHEISSNRPEKRGTGRQMTATTWYTPAGEVRSALGRIPVQGTGAQRKRNVLDIGMGASSAKLALPSTPIDGTIDQAAGGEVFGALARTNARPGRRAGSLAG
jgi:hypothetical protein